MKLLPPQFGLTDFATTRRPVAAQQNTNSAETLEPVSPVIPVSQSRSSGSYSSASEPYRLVAKNIGVDPTPRQSSAANYYAYTASLVADTGELIGIDTYA